MSFPLTFIRLLFLEKIEFTENPGHYRSRVFIFDNKQQAVISAQREFPQYFPQPGWLEHDADEIWQSVLECIKECFDNSNIHRKEIAAIGITNQRETSVVWERKSGKPIHNAVVWQSSQSSDICRQLKEAGLEQAVRKKTGLLIDTYFSGPKIRWILDRCKAQTAAENGELCCGTIDTWLMWKLSGGRIHATDYSNASRTMLYNIHDLCWDDELLDAMQIPKEMLASVLPSSGHFGNISAGLFGGMEIPICAVAGDQQAALFGQGCLQPGMVKNTYGTGCFMLMNTGEKPIDSKSGLLTTIAWGLDNKVHYALEGSVFVAGSALQWLRDGLQIVNNASDSEALAKQLQNNEGVFLVPAFSGLGTPYWKSEVRGACFGLTRASDRRHFCRAALEAIAFQSRDLLEAMCKDSELAITSLRVDGGATKNQFLMQFQSDLLNMEIQLAQCSESTVFGAAALAALHCGLWEKDELFQNQGGKSYQPKIVLEQMTLLYKQWQKAVQAAILFSE